MCPQLVDFEGDGRLDLVMGTFEGTAFVLPRGETGYGAWRRITDREGRNVQLSLFWNRETESWDNADRSPAGAPNEPDHAISAVLVDWDGDLDLDLVLGSKEGRLYLQTNEGTRSAPSYTGVNVPILLATSERPALMVPGGCTAPRIVDWNGDGLFDLVCGSFAGGVFVYPNSGTREAPQFAQQQVLLPNAQARRGAQGGPTRGTYVDAVDYDGDGDLDLLVGGYHEFTPERRRLTDEERAEAQSLEEQIAAVEAELAAWFESAEADENGEFSEAAMETYRAIVARLQPLERRLAALKPKPGERARVWWFERQS